MSREALRRKENSRWARGVLVCGGKTEIWRGLSCWGQSGLILSLVKYGELHVFQ